MHARTEKEKMLAGDPYNILDPDLSAEREKVMELLRLFNVSEALPERHRILQQLLGHIGEDSIVQPPFYCSYGHNTSIG
ncbi:MAG TPA: maltose acetyltransferase domain-containing protein, partial [Actinomycetota bacterium]|nr:maltose acetyltransferase domain-containing protein [Actinomycetota bacterium]